MSTVATMAKMPVALMLKPQTPLFHEHDEQAHDEKPEHNCRKI
jgi:hypothetical protein